MATRDVGVSFEDLEKRKAKKEAGPLTERKLVIVMEPNGLYSVAFEPAGGRLPFGLEGKFTNRNKLEAAIQRYNQEKSGG